MPKSKPKLNISVITLFPDIFKPHLEHLPLRRAIYKNLLQVDFIDLRNFAINKRGTVDSQPYGGGPGMILRPEPIFDAINFAIENLNKVSNNASNARSTRIIFLTPRGQTYHQEKALELSQIDHLIMVCGRYEGIDQRVIDYFTKKISNTSHLNNHKALHANVSAEEISIGNYVLSGGEVPAMVIMESVVRLIPGAIDNPDALKNESFNFNLSNCTEHPQYSRPKEWQSLKVPNILLSGHHKNIDDWKERFGLNHNNTKVRSCIKPT